MRVGDTVPRGSNQTGINQLVNDYPTATNKAQVSEQIGELGAVDYLESVTGRSNMNILRPTSDADVADLVTRFDNGAAWDAPVAFGGRNATNLVYFDGDTLHIIEAKGGTGRYGTRNSNLTPNTRMSQTDPNYPLDVAMDMMDSRLPGRSDIGEVIESAYDNNIVSYVGVRTAGHQGANPGQVETVLENIFKTP